MTADNTRSHRWPENADIAFAIRDDDLSYFTPPERLEQLYGRIWENGFKVSFAAIPNHRAVNKLNVPPPFRQSGEYFAISKNTGLCQYLRERISKGTVEILQHGFCHTADTNLPPPAFSFTEGKIIGLTNQAENLARSSEFSGLSAELAAAQIRQGQQILETAFLVTPKVFVAPQELLTNSLWLAIYRNHLEYCGSVGIKQTMKLPARYVNWPAVLTLIIKRILHFAPESRAAEQAHLTKITTLPANYRHYWNAFRDDASSEDRFNEFKSAFEARRRTNGYFILLTHYWEYFYDWEPSITQHRQSEYLCRILDYVNASGKVWKCTVGELMDKVRTAGS